MIVHVSDSAIYADDIRAELVDLDGVLVWVNETQDGDNRTRLDALLS
jgi:hypothetical protein